MHPLQPALHPALPQSCGEAQGACTLGVQAPPGERHVWAELQLRWSGEHQMRLHLHFTAKAALAEAEEAGSVG
jgi:hypothetical protein